MNGMDPESLPYPSRARQLGVAHQHELKQLLTSQPPALVLVQRFAGLQPLVSHPRRAATPGCSSSVCVAASRISTGAAATAASLAAARPAGATTSGAGAAGCCCLAGPTVPRCEGRDAAAGLGLAVEAEAGGGCRLAGAGGAVVVAEENEKEEEEGGGGAGQSRSSAASTCQQEGLRPGSGLSMARMSAASRGSRASRCGGRRQPARRRASCSAMARSMPAGVRALQGG